VNHPEAGEALALLVVPRNGSATGDLAAEKNQNSEVGERVRRALPAHWTCVSVKIVTELPRTANGKIARAQLPALVGK
jgi:acyl-coenzyme A synthetase/AMP-(fatty) acid ligase